MIGTPLKAKLHTFVTDHSAALVCFTIYCYRRPSSLATWEENYLFQSLSPASQDVEEALRRRQRSTTVEEKEEQLRRAAQELLEGER